MIQAPSRRAALLPAVLAALLFSAPLPFGSVTPAGELGVRAAACLALALTALSDSRLARLRMIAAPLLAALGLGLLGLAQAASWPPALAARISPEHDRLYHQAAEALGEERPLRVPLSLAPRVSLSAALAWAIAATVLAASAVAARRRRHRRWIFGSILAAAVFQLIYGLRGARLEPSRIWGVAVPPAPGRLRGTLVNPDHLALQLEVALAVGFALCWWAPRRVRGERRLERRLLAGALPMLLWLSLFAGLALTGSRAGLAAAIAGTLAQGLLLAAAERRWRPGLAAIAAAAAGLGAVAWLGLQQGLGRWLATSAYEITWSARGQLRLAALELWGRFPWTGSGLGTFADALPLVQPAELAGATWRHAHSDPIELLATGGLAAGLLVVAGLVGLCHRLWRLLAAGERSEDRAAALAACGALVAVGAHELFDFGLQIPANALTLVALLGAAAGARARGDRPDATASADRSDAPAPASPPAPPAAPSRAGGGPG